MSSSLLPSSRLPFTFLSDHLYQEQEEQEEQEEHASAAKEEGKVSSLLSAVLLAPDLTPLFYREGRRERRGGEERG